jgi:3-oxoacyl-[acyl-carrier protein] reductase
MADPTIAFVALGSNLGDREQILDDAVARLRATPGVEVLSISSYHETTPVGGPAGQGNYLNGVVQLRTTLDALALLHVLLAIETQLGRVRTERFGPRTLDLDLLLYGTQTLDVRDASADLILPHPRMHERFFVLEPLVEIAPLAVHPLLQSTAKDLLDRLKAPKPSARELAGKNAVVTGSTSGIGRAIALALADAGANVLIHGRRSSERAEQVAEECRARGVDAMCLLADLSDPSECAGIVGFAFEMWEPEIDVWINNAGADTLTGEAAQWSFERKLQELLAVDLRATMLIARAVGARMKAQGRGVLLNMGWDQAETGMEGDSGQLFGAAKGAVMAFTKSLALSLAPEVRVNCIAPGWIRTAWGAQASESWQTRVLRETPLARWGTPEDIANAVRWLAAPASAFVTGQVVKVNGGVI